MTDNPRGLVTFEADGATWRLQYTFNALCELEEASGFGMTEFVKRMSDPAGLRVRDARTMFWAGLVEHHPEIDQRAAGNLIGALGGLPAAMPLIERAFLGAQAETAAQEPASGNGAAPARKAGRAN
jgi:hypothetical protein